jgi:hypothetical protein
MKTLFYVLISNDYGSDYLFKFSYEHEDIVPVQALAPPRPVDSEPDQVDAEQGRLEVGGEERLLVMLESILRNRFDRNLQIKPNLGEFKFVIEALKYFKPKIIVHKTRINLYVLLFGWAFVQNLRMTILSVFGRNGAL